MEDWVNFPLRGEAEAECHVGYDFLHLKGTSLFHLELFRSIHTEVGHFEPHFVSNFPGHKLQEYPFFHFLLGHFVGGLGILTSGR